MTTTSRLQQFLDRLISEQSGGSGRRQRPVGAANTAVTRTVEDALRELCGPTGIRVCDPPEEKRGPNPYSNRRRGPSWTHRAPSRPTRRSTASSLRASTR